MAQIQLTGLSTGIDTSAIVKQLMAVESQRLNKLNTNLDDQKQTKEALSTLEKNLKALQNALGDLSDAGDLRSFKTSSSDSDVLTAESSERATEGTHTVVIDQLATPERWVHSLGIEYPEDYVGSGRFIYSYNNEESIITTTDDTTLEDLVGLINNDADNPGVTASILYHDGAYHLVLSGDNAGSDYQISINSSNTEVWESASALTDGNSNGELSTRITDLDQFSGVLQGDESITISGTLRDGTEINQTFNVTQDTKLSKLIGEINSAFGDTATATLVNGQIVLTDHTCGTSQMTLSLSYDPGSGSTTFSIPAISRTTEGGNVEASLAGFTQGDFVETQSAQDSRFKVDGYPPGEDQWITRSTNTISDVIAGVTLELHDTGTVQVTLARNTESLERKLTAFVDAYNEVMTFIKDNTGYDESTKVAGQLMGDSTVTNINNDLHLTLIRKALGFLLSTDTYLTPAQMGLELDGEGTLSLDTSVLNDAISEDYDGVLALIGADKTGSSNSNAIQFYGASSKYTTAGTYNVQVVVSGGAITSAKIKSSDESTYRDATINGNIITGNSVFDSNGNPVYDENGLQLTIDLSNDGTYSSTVQVKQGFAGTMEDVVERLLKTNTGYLVVDQNAIDDQIQLLNDSIEKEQERLDRVESRLTTKYAKLESTLTLLQRQMAALKAM
jgi:flagellar capping protein FliD